MSDRVKIAISTSSRTIHWPLPKPDPANLPKISMNGVPIPSPAWPPDTPTGYQVVVINAAYDITDPANITANEYVAVNSDQDTGFSH
jgi:hypothetical protein